MERLRTRIATDLHDDIGASLTQISILTELARRGTAPHVLADIANIARGLVSDMSDIVWAVNPRHDRFEGLVHRMRRFANDVLGGADIDVEFETANLPADVAVPLESRRPLYLVLKEAVNNVARHSGSAQDGDPPGGGRGRLETDRHRRRPWFRPIASARRRGPDERGATYAGDRRRGDVGSVPGGGHEIHGGTAAAGPSPPHGMIALGTGSPLK